MPVDLTGLKSVVTEILGENELVELLSNGEDIRHYIGFEISGLVHLGQGLAVALVIRELQKLGIKTSIYLADWHTWINDKLGGDMELIKKTALEYFMPAMQESLKIVGGDPAKLEFILGSDLYHHNDRFWQTVVEVGKNLTVSRVKKSTTIMGRTESDEMKFAMLLYPPMQVADIFEMKCQIAHAGTDQRKCHVIAREVALNLKINPLKNKSGKIIKPVCIHHSLISGLQTPAEWPIPADITPADFISKYKMSKSVYGSAVFVQDTPEEIKDKINKAFCPEKEIGYNPVLNWVDKLVFPIKQAFEVLREEKFGGNKTYTTFSELENSFKNGELHPVDLKSNVARILTEILAPIRERFNNSSSIELINTIKNFKKQNN